MSYDALMRWEWEGGTPASVTDRGEEAVRAEARGEHPRRPPQRESHWLERELLPTAPALTTVEVKQIVVPPALPAELGAFDV